MKVIHNNLNDIIKNIKKLAKKVNILYIVTGPTAAGKSTFMQLKTDFPVEEYYDVVDVSKNNWWVPLQKYAMINNTNIVESHFLYQRKNFMEWCLSGKIPETFGSNIVKPPENVIIYWIIPSFKRLHEQIKRRGWETSVKKTRCEYNYYNLLRKAMGSSNHKLIKNF